MVGGGGRWDVSGKYEGTSCEKNKSSHSHFTHMPHTQKHYFRLRVTRASSGALAQAHNGVINDCNLSWIKRPTQDEVLFVGVADAYRMLTVRHVKLEDFVDVETGCISKGEHGVVRVHHLPHSTSHPVTLHLTSRSARHPLSGLKFNCDFKPLFSLHLL